jgi:hypothetical protein
MFPRYFLTQLSFDFEQALTKSCPENLQKTKTLSKLKKKENAVSDASASGECNSGGGGGGG